MLLNIFIQFLVDLHILEVVLVSVLAINYP